MLRFLSKNIRTNNTKVTYILLLELELKILLNDPDRLLGTNEKKLSLAKDIYNQVANLPIISPHGHSDPIWFSQNKRFPNPAELFVLPDHYVFRMLVSQGFKLSELGVKSINGNSLEKDPREVWKIFCENYYLFRGTPTAIWLDYSFEYVFGLSEPLTAENTDFYYDHIEDKLAQAEFLPRALFNKFNVEVLATTDSALSQLNDHQQLLMDVIILEYLTLYTQHKVYREIHSS